MSLLHFIRMRLPVRRFRSLLILLIFLFGTAGAVFVAQKVQEYRGRAAAGSFYDTFFPIGAFDAMIPGPNELTAYINDVTARGMDSLMMNNNNITNPLQQQMLAAADQKNFNMLEGPQNELYSQWWNDNTVTVDLATAKQIAQPLVDLMKIHPSLKGYNLVDDADGQSLLKRNLMQQAFYELDPTRQVSYIQGATPDRYDFVNNIQPRAVYSYGYPASVGLSACDWRRGDLGQRTWVDNFRIGKQFIPDNTPSYQILQTHQTQKDINGTILNDASALRYPTVEELRLQQWLAIGEGATGLFWFTYNDLTTPPGQPSWIGWRNNPTFLTEITDLSQRIQPFKPTLAQLKKIDDKFTVSGTGKVYTSTFLHKIDNRIFVLVSNLECTQQTLTLSTTYVTGQLKDLETNATQNITDPITLRGGDGKVFELVNASLITPQPTPAPITNLIQNPGFETLDGTGKPVAWTAAASNIDSTVKHSGNNSIKVVGPVNELYFWNKPTLKPNTKYFMSAWVKTNNATKVGPDYIVENPGLPGAFGSIRLGSTYDWRKIYTYFMTPSNYVSGRLDIRFTIPTGGAGWIDDVEVCEVNESCTSLPFTTLQPFTPTPTIAAIQSPVAGVIYQNKPWTDTELTTFITNLSDTVITHHAKKNVLLPELAGMIYEWAKINPDRAWEDNGWDTMHDGAWFGNALASAYRATRNDHFVDLLNNYTLTFYPTILNNSDKYFVLDLPAGAGVVSSVNLIPRPTNYPNNPVSKGIPDYLYDDGESKTFDGSTSYIGYRTGKYTSLHMQVDVAQMLASTGLLTNRSDVKLALKNLALGNATAYGDEAGGHPAVETKLFALKLNPGDTELTSKFTLPGILPSGSFSDPNNPPFGKSLAYSTLYLNTPASYGNHLDGPVWTYYRWLLDQDRKPLDDVFAKQVTSTAYTNIVVDQLWYGTERRQPGLNDFDSSLTYVSEKFSPYYADDLNHPKGSRYGTQVMLFAAAGLQLLKAFPNAWTKFRDTCCASDIPIEIRWTSPGIDGTLDASGYSTPITVDTDVTARLGSSIDTLYLFVDRPSGKNVPLMIYARADGVTLGATITIDGTGNVIAKGRNGTDDLIVTKATGTANGREQLELAIPFTVVKTQKPWANAVDDSRLSLKGANGQLKTLFFLSSPETVRAIFEKELIEGLRFWEFVLTDWKMIPAGFYPQDGKNGLWSGNKSPDGFSDTGGYAGVINAASMYKEYLDSENDWDLYKTVTAVGVTPQPTNTPTITPTPTNTPSPTPTPVPGINLLLNSSFESNNNGIPANWSGGTWDNTVAHTGTASMKIAGPGDNYSYHKGTATTDPWQPILKPNTTYTIQGWIKTDTIQTTDFGAQIRYVVTQLSTDIFETSLFRGTNNWTFFTRTFTTPADYQMGRLDMHAAISSGATAWFDDVALCEGTCPVSTNPTPSPTLTATNTPTINPTTTLIPTLTPSPGRTLSLNLLLNAIGNGGDSQTPGAAGNFSPLTPQRTLVVEYYTNPLEAPSETGSAMVTFNSSGGNFLGSGSIPSNLPDGSYLVRLKTGRYLRVLAVGFITLDSTNTTSSIPLAQTTLIVGDSNGDNSLDIIDYNIIADCYSVNAPPRNCTDPQRKLSADLNDDGYVDGVDINYLVRNATVRSGE
ncbi:MAG: carbohydrate binding domain-containing protein [bacterium]|nr:carbohydrate binding domain-containing protein [bacterium]